MTSSSPSPPPPILKPPLALSIWELGPEGSREIAGASEAADVEFELIDWKMEDFRGRGGRWREKREKAGVEANSKQET